MLFVERLGQKQSFSGGGIFVRETKCRLVFRGFQLNKSCIVKIEEETEENKQMVAYLENLLQ